MDIGAQIHFQEVTQAGHGGAESWADATHEKRYDGDPGFSIKRVHMQSRGESLLHFRWIHGPMQEEQILPALVHDHGLIWDFTHGLALGVCGSWHCF
jgi:hypothetical protein